MDYNDSKSAVGLEHIADVLEEETELPQSLESEKEEGDLDVFNSWRTSSSTNTEHSLADKSSVHYGAISDKIGEASVSWLTRWGQDLLNYEMNGLSNIRTLRRVKSFPPLGKASDVDAKIDIPVIWRRRGLSASWVRAIVSSDSLFVKNERHRYDFARSVVELRRQHGLMDEEEKVWALMFDQSIYYANMVCICIICLPCRLLMSRQSTT